MDSSLPSYSPKELKLLSKLLSGKIISFLSSHPGFANNRSLHKFLKKESFRMHPFTIPFERIPLELGRYVSSKDTDWSDWCEAILKWRLEIGK